MKGVSISVQMLLPPRLREKLDRLSPKEAAETEEIRLRSGRPPSVLIGGREKSLGGRAVENADIVYVLDRASRSSLHSVRDELRSGFVTAQGGIRIGICGRVGGDTVREFSSLAIRLPHEKRGVGAEIIKKLAPFDKSVLVISPPGGGKTTFLRELIRCASESGRRVSVCDERCEIAALWNGQASFELGAMTDVMSGCSKAEGIVMLLRAMNPEIIAFDEIGADADFEAVERAVCCGVNIFATAHGATVEDIRRRKIYRGALAGGIFERAVVISGNGERKYELVELC